GYRAATHYRRPGGGLVGGIPGKLVELHPGQQLAPAEVSRFLACTSRGSPMRRRTVYVIILGILAAAEYRD
ncbi:MAG: hypothetical protein JXA57_01885, partial [Armatimonadetes bacterium]|nr:hypothetical protein [Armatimonadota bacterium]